MISNKNQLSITFLGTGTSHGVPMIACNDRVCLSKNAKDKRLRSSILISWENVVYTVDCSLDFRQQMLRENVQTLNGVFFTHEHADHVGGIDDLRAYCYKAKNIKIFLKKRTLKNIEKRYEYIFCEKKRHPGAPRLYPKIIDKTPFEVSGLKVVPIEVMHGKLPITAYRFNNVAYLTDVKLVSKEEKLKLKNLDVLIVNSIRIKEHSSHFNLEEALNFVEEIKPKKAYLTHISHKLGLHDEVSKILPKNVFLAYDGLIIKV